MFVDRIRCQAVASCMSRRTWLVSVSIVGHLAIGVGLFASGIWKLEKLESDHRMAGIGIMVPTMASGGQQDLPEHKFVKKEKAEKKVVKDVQWDKRVETDDKPKVVATAEIGDGEGDGPGKGPGKGPGDNIVGEIDGEPCAAPPCGPVVKLPEPPKLPDPPVAQIAPHTMQALRISGETQIHPSRTVKNQILADGKSKVIGALKVCIQPTGAIGSVSLLSSTKYPEYDQQLLDAARRWHYRPYSVNGVATRACAAVAFVYSIK
jgi:TonB family protein